MKQTMPGKWGAAHLDSELSDFPALTQAVQEKHFSFYCKRSRLYLILPVLEVKVLKYWALSCAVSQSAVHFH